MTDQVGRAVTERVPYHVGVLVPDVPAAVKAFEATLGYRFNEPKRLQLYDLEDRIAGTSGPAELLVTYSRTGPLRIELIQSGGSGLYDLALGEGFHHVGVWEADPEARLRELEAAGQSIDAVLRGRDGSISVFYASPSASSGVRVEYVNEAQRARLERWFETGELQ
jgi:catechol 2,3-dioxygenase-like lactoylglutathione lyase family enzyme